MGHSSIERGLRISIQERHSLKNEIRKKRWLIAKLTKRLERTKKERLNNRYSATIKRLDAEARTLEYKLNDMNLDLQKRISDEMEFSEEEIRNFRERYQEEYVEIRETEDKLKVIEEGTVESDVEETSGEELAPKEAIVARTKRMLNRERRIAEGIKREISSEERDRVLFVSELQHIMAELEAYEGK